MLSDPFKTLSSFCNEAEASEPRCKTPCPTSQFHLEITEGANKLARENAGVSRTTSTRGALNTMYTDDTSLRQTAPLQTYQHLQQLANRTLWNQ